MYQVKIINTIDNKLIKEWQELWKRAENSNIFNSYEWFLTSKTVNEKADYEFYVCYKEDKLVALLPVQQYRVFGINVFGTINKEHLIDTAFLVERYDKKLYKEFFSEIFKKRNIYMQKVDNNDVKILHELFPKLFFSLISVNPQMHLDKDPFESSSPSTISQIRRIIRKNPEMRFEMFDDDLDKHMKTMFKLHKKSSKKVRQMDIFEDKKTKEYYTILTKNFAKAMRICFLYMGDLPIAYQYGFSYRDIFVGDQIAYHNDYSKLRPGKTIVYFLTEYLKNNKMRILDQGGGISSYKMEFAKEYRLLYNLYYSPNILIMVWWKLINTARRMRQVISPKKFTRDHEFLFRTI
jgi:GNAT acetyltransferase-like protein